MFEYMMKKTSITQYNVQNIQIVFIFGCYDKVLLHAFKLKFELRI